MSSSENETKNLLLLNVVSPLTVKRKSCFKALTLVFDRINLNIIIRSTRKRKEINVLLPPLLYDVI